MGFGCPICSEKLDKLPAEAQTRGNSRGSGELNISATPCGHIFHAYCIQKWLTGNLASSKQCPCCRKDVPRLRCLSLFPTTYDESILDDSFSQSSSEGGSGGGGMPIPCNHLEVINSLKSQIKRVEDELEENKRLYNLLSEDYTTLDNRFRQEKMSSDMWMMKAKQYESYQDLANEYGSKAKSLEQKLKSFTLIEALLKGNEDSVKEDQSFFPPNAESVKTLLEMKHVLTAELRNTSKKLSESKTNYENLRSEKMKLRVQYDKIYQEFKELQHMYEIARVNGGLRSTSPVAGPSRSTDPITPKEFRLSKRRMQEPLSETMIAKIRSPDLDCDVDLFPSAVRTKKMKISKPSKAPPPPVSGEDSKAKKIKSTKFPCLISPIPQKEGIIKVSQNSTINIYSSDSETDIIGESDEDDDFKIRGCVPGAPLPIAANRVKNLQQRAEKPVLGLSRSKASTKPGVVRKKL